VSALLEVVEVHQRYRLPREHLLAAAPVVHALRGVSLAMRAGVNLGIVGESGSGKSTLARLVMALERPAQGRVSLLGRDLNALPAAALREARRDFQMVFQDPYGSLDPRQKVGRIVAEPLPRAEAAQAPQRVAEALEAVGLRGDDAAKYPHEFSGGQRQRIAIARALITRPQLIVADEPVSALDVSVQAQVLNLMLDLQQRLGVTYLFISHDLAVVDHVCAQVAVLFAGRVVEQGPTDTLFQAAAHPYTRSLMAAVPRDRRLGASAAAGVASRRASIGVEPEGAGDGGCAFAPRCQHRQPRCAEQVPALRELGPGHAAACHLAEQVMAEPF
jgi:peptide/nickel transport system ATP-binding protein